MIERLRLLLWPIAATAPAPCYTSGMSEDVITGLPCVLFGVVVIILRKWLAEKIDQTNRRWWPNAQSMSRPAAIAMAALALGAICIVMGLLAIFGSIP